jgi:uncharacterized protein with GYD domain
MPIFITQGRYTREAIAGMVQKPEDRARESKKLVEAAGGKHIASYFTFGEFDFIDIFEAPDPTAIASALIAAAGGGSVTDVRTTLALSWTDAKKAFESAGGLASGFRSAGAR